MVASALEMDSELLAVAPELLADLDALGADVATIVTVISELDLAPGASALDLGSGKGAVAIELARRLDLDVHGIELFEPFVDHARAAAGAAGVSGRCRFTHGDVTRLAGQLPPADVAVFAALGGALGPIDVTMGILRRFVRPGGYVVISDSCRRDGDTTAFPGFEHHRTAAETRRLLTAHGDALVAERLEPDDSDGTSHAEDAEGTDDDGSSDTGDTDETGDGTVEIEVLAARAADLARRRPELGDALASFIEAQRAEYDFLDRHMVGAVWVVQRR